MICETCRIAAAVTADTPPDTPLDELRKLHRGCKGDTHCDCQHKPTIRMFDGSLAQRVEQGERGGPS